MAGGAAGRPRARARWRGAPPGAGNSCLPATLTEGSCVKSAAAGLPPSMGDSQRAAMAARLAGPGDIEAMTQLALMLHAASEYRVLALHEAKLRAFFAH